MCYRLREFTQPISLFPKVEEDSVTTAREREELLMKKKVILERVLAKLKELILINLDKGPFIYDVHTDGGYAKGTNRMGGCLDITLYFSIGIKYLTLIYQYQTQT